MIELVPAIDIIGARCVRLTRGDYSKQRTYDCEPREMAHKYLECGVRRIHVVDLDGARLGRPANIKVLKSLSTLPLEIEWGGGISSAEALDEVFDAGATHAIIGSVAAREPELFAGWLEQYGSRMILGADVREGRVAIKGWSETAELTIEQLIQRFEGLPLKEVICTDISRDGMLCGPSFELYETLQREFPDLSITVSGGISSMEDIRALDRMGLRRVIVGKAIYEGHITMEDIRIWSQRG